MNRVLRLVGPFLLGLAVILFVRGPATSQSAVPSAQPRIGIISIQDAIIGTQQGKKELAVLQATFAPRQNQLKALNDEVESMKTNLQAKSAALTEEERNRQLQALEAKQKTLQRNYEDTQSDVQKAEQEVLERLGKKMIDVVSDYATSHGMDVIIDVSNPQTPVIWASKDAYITKELVVAYDAKYPQR